MSAVQERALVADAAVSVSPDGRGRGWWLALVVLVAAGLGLGVWFGLGGSESLVDGGAVELVTVSGSERVSFTTTPEDKEDWSGFTWLSAPRSMSDPRVEGSGVTGVNVAVGVDRVWSEVHNDHGAWVGMATGVHELTGNPARTEHEELLVGTGTFAGLQVRTRMFTEDRWSAQRWGTIEPFGTWAPGAATPSMASKLSCQDGQGPSGWAFSGWHWFECQHHSPDRRLDGTATLGRIEDPEIERGFFDLTTSAGRWRGTFVGLNDEDGYRLEGLLVGTGEHGGTQYRFQASSVDGSRFDLQGAIEPAQWFKSEQPPINDGFTPSERASIVARSVRIAGDGCGHAIEGSGFVVGDNLITTAAHVLSGAENLAIETADGRSLTPTVVGLDTTNDLALLTVPDLGLEPLDLAEPTTDSIGLVAGWHDTARPGPTPFRVLGPITKAIDEVGTRTPIERDSWQVAARIAPGYSGAALIDHNRHIIAIVYGTTTTGEPITYTVSATTLQQLITTTDTTTQPELPACP